MSKEDTPTEHHRHMCKRKTFKNTGGFAKWEPADTRPLWCSPQWAIRKQSLALHTRSNPCIHPPEGKNNNFALQRLLYEQYVPTLGTPKS